MRQLITLALIITGVILTITIYSFARIATLCDQED